MTEKLGRNYQLVIELPIGLPLIIEPPFTIEFDITRHTLASANVCQIRIYNLSKFNRSQIAFNAYNQSNFRSIQLNAGYGSNLITIFSGNISQAWSVREGVNFITQIECYDGGFAFVNSTINISFPAGTPIQLVIETLMASLGSTSTGGPTGISVGAIGTFPGVLPKGNTYSGNPAQILYELTGGAFFIDQGKAYALPSNQYSIALPIVVVDASSGLLNTPILEQTIVRFDMIFEPSLNIGGLATLISLTNPILNNTYKITSVKHRGIISPVVSGDLITTGEFFYSNELTPAI